jgi:hypothetical protein
MNIKQSKHKNPIIAGSLTMLCVLGMSSGVKVLQNREASLEAKRLSAAQSSNKGTVAIVSAPKQTPITPPPTTPVSTAPPPVVAPVAPPPVVKPSVTQVPPTPPPVIPPPPVVYTYKDGTYSAVGSFPVPGLTTKINVTIVVVQDVVTDSTVTIPAGTDPTSKNYDGKFIASYKPYVVGKPLISLSLSKVAASSLTPNGFNNALNQIRVSAKG